MRLEKLAKLLLVPLFFMGSALPAGSAPQTHRGTYAEFHARHALGRVKVSSDGRFFLYEWGRPYLDWVPETPWMTPNAARRLQTVLYKVNLTRRGQTSEYLLFPNARCTYWLGDLSPDNKHVIVFELNQDESRARAGVWSSKGTTVRWFGPAADVRTLEEMTSWISNEEFVYPVQGRMVPFARASILTHKTRPCPTCTTEMMRSIHTRAAFAALDIKAMASYLYSRGVPKDAQLLGAAANGSVAVFARDTPDTLSLIYKKLGQPVKVVFENKRR